MQFSPDAYRDASCPASLARCSTFEGIYVKLTDGYGETIHFGMNFHYAILVGRPKIMAVGIKMTCLNNCSPYCVILYHMPPVRLWRVVDLPFATPTQKSYYCCRCDHFIFLYILQSTIDNLLIKSLLFVFEPRCVLFLNKQPKNQFGKDVTAAGSGT